jgi:hypothetical protein
VVRARVRLVVVLFVVNARHGVPERRGAGAVRLAPLEFEQDLYLLWPGEVIGTDATGGIDLTSVVAAQVSVIGRGRVRLQAQRHYESPADTVVVPTGAPFVSVVRTGGPMGRSPAATYIRIPWNWHLANQACLMSVHFVAKPS